MPIKIDKSSFYLAKISLSILTSVTVTFRFGLSDWTESLETANNIATHVS